MTTKQKAIIGTTLIIAVVTSGTALEYYVDKDIELRGKMYSGYGYNQIKTQLVEKIEKRTNENLPTYEEGEIWKALLQKELGKCDKFRMPGNVTKKNIIDKLNQAVKNGCE